MLSEEEKKAIEHLKDYLGDLDLAFNGIITTETAKDYKTILNLIEKQQKEIEELKAINRKLEARKYMFNAETGEVTAIPIDNNYISKDKIKAKIEEYRRLLYSYEKDLEEKLHYVDKGSMNCIIAQIQILQSLLEKE